MNKKPDAIVFFDLDGTLFNSNVEVLPSSLEAIKKLKQNNILPIIATGRTACEVIDVMDNVGIDSIIAMNGQAVLYEGIKVFSNDIDKNIIKKVHQFSKEQTEIPLSFHNEELMRISENSESAKKLFNYLKQPIPDIDDTIYLTTPIQMLLLLCETGESIYPDVFPELTFIRNTPYGVDVFNKGGSKGNGIVKLLENKNFIGIPTFAFGDGMNDLEMFDTVDHPIAMANAVDKLKDKAEIITDSNNNDGIAKALKTVGLI